MRGVTVVQDLDQRYNALLQMYGEKVEEAQELRMDLVDVKDLYKSQVPTPRRIYIQHAYHISEGVVYR